MNTRRFEKFEGIYYRTTVVQLPTGGGWLVTHMITDWGGCSVHSIVVPDEQHLRGPSEFCIHQDMKEII